jgi:hypothetical protein
MRGYYVGLLAAIRLDYVPSLLGLVDGRGALLVSEAEGFFMTYLLIRRFEQPIGRTLGKVLIPFGRNSLNVYVAQSFVMFLAPFVFAPHRFVINPLFDAAVIAVVYLGVRTRFLAFLAPRA